MSGSLPTKPAAGGTGGDGGGSEDGAALHGVRAPGARQGGGLLPPAGKPSWLSRKNEQSFSAETVW